MFIPKSIEEMLRRYGLQGDPQEWECLARPLSEDNIILEFPNHIVLHVVHSTWTRKTLAQLDCENIDVASNTIRIPKNLSTLRVDISLYADGSTRVVSSSTSSTTEWVTGSTQAQLTQWKKELQRKSNSLWNRWIIKNQSYKKLIALLSLWEKQQREKYENYSWTLDRQSNNHLVDQGPSL